MKLKFISLSEKNTRDFGKFLADEILKSKLDLPLFIILKGELGAGKTTLIKGFLAGLGIRKRIISPTFILFRKYRVSGEKNQKIKLVYHFDLYRLFKKEVKKLFKELFLEKAIFLIEWGEKIKSCLPKNKIVIELKHLKNNEREILIYQQK